MLISLKRYYILYKRNTNLNINKSQLSLVEGRITRVFMNNWDGSWLSYVLFLLIVLGLLTVWPWQINWLTFSLMNYSMLSLTKSQASTHTWTISKCENRSLRYCCHKLSGKTLAFRAFYVNIQHKLQFSFSSCFMWRKIFFRYSLISTDFKSPFFSLQVVKLEMFLHL